MYSIDLSQITLDEFEAMVAATDLLPSRRVLTDHLGAVVGQLKTQGLAHLGEVQRLLRSKQRYPALAHDLGVTPDYLTILNREINSYQSRPHALTKLDLFTGPELERLTAAGVTSTQDLYERGLTRAARQALADELDIPPERIRAALELTDLLRINGVGPVFAQTLRAIGITSAAGYLETASQDIQARYTQHAAQTGHAGAALGLKDIDYCKRFCARLDAEIEW